jgi:hypothetical protein
VHTTSGGLTPVLLVFGPNGESAPAPQADGSFLLHLNQSGTYSLVIGARDGNSTGSYTLGLNRFKDIGTIPLNPNSTLSQVSQDESGPASTRIANQNAENSVISTVAKNALDSAILHSGVPLVAIPDSSTSDSNPADTSSDQSGSSSDMTDNSQSTDTSSDTSSTAMDASVAPTAVSDSSATTPADGGSPAAVAATTTPTSSASSTPASNAVAQGSSVTVETGRKFKGVVKITPPHHVHTVARFHFGPGSKGRA